MLTRLHDALRLRTSPAIFFGSAAIILAFVIATIAFTEPMGAATASASSVAAWISSSPSGGGSWASRGVANSGSEMPRAIYTRRSSGGMWSGQLGADSLAK